jgi:hypothetical protein
MHRGLTFAEFAQSLDERLWLLGIVPAFTLDDLGARWSCAPYAAELQPFDASRARVVLCAHGRPCYASEPGPMTAAGASTLARAVGMLFGGRAVVNASASTTVARRAHTPPHVTSEITVLPAQARRIARTASNRLN